MPNLGLIFTTGLLTGGLTCLALQGGLLVSANIKREGIVIFLLAKLLAYTVLGFLLGMLGSILQLTLTMRIILQLAVVVFMFGSAMNILNIHPIFRYFAIQPPRFLTKYLRGQTSPILLGIFTIFIPCGTTQAMMALAISSGSPLSGALIMAVFILGTSPVFFVLGNVFSRLGKLTAAVLLILAVYNLEAVLAMTGHPVDLRYTWRSFYCTVSFCSEQKPTDLVAAKEVTVYIDSNGYNPKNLAIKAGEEITLTIVNRGGYGCIQAFTIPSLGIQKIIPPGQTQTIKFTAPTKVGDLNFMCSMGMYRGSFRVI